MKSLWPGKGGERFEGAAEIGILTRDCHEVEEGPLGADGKGTVNFLQRGAAKRVAGEDGIGEFGPKTLTNPGGG